MTVTISLNVKPVPSPIMVLCDFTLADLLREARGIHPNAIVSNIAAWTRRYAPFMFCGSTELAARVAESFFCGQVREIERQSKVLEKQAA